MKRRYILYRRKRGGMFYIEDTETRKQESTGTRNRAEATSLLNARNESIRQPQLNLQIAKAYLAGTDSGVSKRTWQDAFNAITENKHGSTGVGKTETVIVTTNQIFGPGQLFRFDMSEFQNQESLGLLLGARLGEVGYLGGVRERAAEGSLLFDEAEKAHPRVLDILLQLLDAARITVATGQTLDFSNYYIWLTSNIGSAELMSLQHSNDATLERHVLTRAQQSLRPEIFARVNEKLVFRRLGYEHQLEIAEKFIAREIEFLRERGHKLELDKTVLPFLVRKGFHPKLGARPMRDAVEKLVGDAVAECLLHERPACGALTFDEMRDCLNVL